MICVPPSRPTPPNPSHALSGSSPVGWDTVTAISDAAARTAETDLAAAICDLLLSFGRLIATRPAQGSRFDADRFEDLGQFHNQAAQLCRQLDRLTGQG